MAMVFQVLRVIFAVVVLGAGQAPAKDQELGGLVAASVGEQVVLVEPTSGNLALFAAGPVGWLYQAPGGVLYAPDLVNGKTTVIDLRQLRVEERMDGVTMPIFGPFRDRYLVVTSSEVLMVSYPERAPILQVPVEIGHPWQVEIMADGRAILILDRMPDGEGGATLVAVDLVHRQLVYANRLVGDVVRMEWMYALGLLAVADGEGHSIHLMDPKSRMRVFSSQVMGEPVDLVAFGDGRQLAVLVRDDEGVGKLLLWDFRAKKAGLQVKNKELIELPTQPLRLTAATGGQWLAVALDSGEVVIVDGKQAEVVRKVKMPGTVRDLVWCDPGSAAPSMARWSDRPDGTVDIPDGFGP